MITEDKFGLRSLWDGCIEIYREVAKICDKHHLRYYVTDGTALGAIRHKGYIPWDDDFDISMPRPDYEKFKRIAPKELPDYLCFWDYRDNPKFIYLFGKVQDTRAYKVLALEEKLGFPLSNGLFIDIFPIDGYPESKVEIVWTKIVTGIAKCILRFRCMGFREQSCKGKLIWFLGLFFSFLMFWPSQKRCLDWCEGRLKLNEFDESPFNGRTCSSTNLFRRAPLKREAWGTSTLYEFHDTQVMLPEDADAHLRNEYYKWDYMELPPESQRHPTHVYAYHCPWWLGPKKKG